MPEPPRRAPRRVSRSRRSRVGDRRRRAAPTPPRARPRAATRGGTAAPARSACSPNVIWSVPIASRATVDEHLLGHGHQLLVVAVGLVELEHRELGVVLRRDPLVPEVAVDLVDPLDAADRQPLQIQLRRDAQEQLHVERVVMRHERPRQRAAGDRLHHRRLDFEVAARVQEAADRRQHPAADLEHPARVRVDDQIEIALAVARSRRRSARATSRAAAGSTWPGTRAPTAQIVSSLVLVRNRCPSTPTKSPKSSSLKIAKSRSRQRVLADVDLDPRPRRPR